MDYKIVKYPRTQHLEGSRLGPGDEDLDQIPFSDIFGRHIVIEEKIDGANSAVSFDGDGKLLLQSRGHYLDGGYRERHYNLFKQWGNNHCDELFDVLGSRYIMYGEWLYAKHKVYYNALPHYFLEFDIFDKECGVYLDTGRRMEILDGSTVKSVPVLFDGVLTSREQLLAMIKRSNYIKGDHLSELAKKAERKFEGLHVHVHRIENKFFGDKITVSGLIVGHDLVSQLQGNLKSKTLLIPHVMIRAGGNVFLDDMTLAEAGDALQASVVPVKTDGKELLLAMIGK